MGYSFRLASRVLLYPSSHRQDNTYHSLCYTSRGALAGTRNSSLLSEKNTKKDTDVNTIKKKRKQSSADFSFQIGKRYPNTQVKLNMKATKSPMTSIGKNTISINFAGDIDLYAVRPKGNDAYLLTVNTVSATFVQANLTDGG